MKGKPLWNDETPDSIRKGNERDVPRLKEELISTCANNCDHCEDVAEMRQIKKRWTRGV